MSQMETADADFDDEADRIIRDSLNLDKPVSFFLYAGAGSGKTRSLVGAIAHVLASSGRRLLLSRQKIGVITYTNAACDEIRHRLEYDPRVDVSTIHAFAWSLIDGRTEDIRAWVRQSLEISIAELKEQIDKTKNTKTQAYQDRVRSHETKTRRLEGIASVKKFIYSPNGDNRSRDSLNHSEVIAIVAQYLVEKPALQQLLISRYPILLVDESQDTNKGLMEALLTVQAARSGEFSLGLVGDTMQRIYLDGKSDLGTGMQGWALPRKLMNHRSDLRIIELINRVRADADGNAQVGRTGKDEGFVRLFAFGNDVDKQEAESKVAAKMAEITGDEAWEADGRQFKTLTLEHHMAAARFGFDAMFEPLYASKRLQTGLLDGSSAPLRFFSKQILPTVKALLAEDRFAATSVIREFSPLLASMNLKNAGEDQIEALREAQKACEELHLIFQDEKVPSFLEVLEVVAKSGLFAVPDALTPFIRSDVSELELDTSASKDELDGQADNNQAWRSMLSTPFWQIEAYDEYVSGLSPFGTHQGVKGLEFPRVMVVISDEEARGFLFSYDKLFGLKPPSANDLKREAEGEDTAVARTRRLFYVTCSRAEKSLAIVCYTNDPDALASSVVDRGWFDESEVLRLR
ncbi:UvrD-helicase domain-containing protein [Primorskyibacter marinus]|uniref:UvrD-helicase domain-containing protein n=1 Tax=Primorskyibacter marinus TaxID=1977320 RepID=UPI0018E58A23|nr:UvrD-helicase domain-containing protein [Primorskyibacter marinus]